MNSIVVHYKELALKGRNRPWFIQHLVRNLQVCAPGSRRVAVRALMGRIDIEIGAASNLDRPTRGWRGMRCASGFGGFSASPTSRLPVARRTISTRWPRRFCRSRRHATAESFRVSARRADKRMPFTSPQVEREVGGRIKEAKGWRVDLDDPALTIHLEMLPDHAFYFFGKEAGAGGLPTGTGGRVACLLSGGIDSPVAAYRMMRRGCSVLLIHFHSYPILSRASQEKVREIAALLTSYQLRSRLMLVPFGELQQQVLLAVPAELRVVVYRRLMLRIAERLARQWRARALVTGEVVGQVASQTLENLTTIGGATTMEILRPLIGMDKDEIVASAERSGRFRFRSFPIRTAASCSRRAIRRHGSDRGNRGGRAALPIEEMVETAVASGAGGGFPFSGARILDYRE